MKSYSHGIPSAELGHNIETITVVRVKRLTHNLCRKVMSRTGLEPATSVQCRGYCDKTHVGKKKLEPTKYIPTMRGYESLTESPPTAHCSYPLASCAL